MLLIWLLACPKGAVVADGGLEALEAARAALGPGALQVEFSGSIRYEGHFATPGHVETWKLEGDVALDSGRVRSTWRVPEVGWTETVTGGELAERVQAGAPWPGLLLDDMLTAPANVRSAGRNTWLWAADGLWTLTLEDGLPSRLERRRAHPVFGDLTEAVTWSGWEEVAGHLVPGAWTANLADTDTRWSLEAQRSRAVAPAPAPPEPQPLGTRTLQPGVHVVELPDANARSLVVTRGTEGVVFDPPLSSALGAELLAAARDLGPEVEDWVVVVSHHHPHYTGGLRPFARAGIEIAVAEPLVGWVTELLQAPRLLDPSDPPVADPRVVVSTERAGVELIDLGAESGHTDSYRVAVFPDLDLLYAADLLSFPTDGPSRRGPGMWAVLERAPSDVSTAFSAWPLEGTEATGPLRLQVALTFDDLPSQTVRRGVPTVDDPGEQRRISEKILAVLAEHEAPAAVFVNCGLLGDSGVLELWRDAGMEVGNHTHTHVRASGVELDAWTEDVRACDRVLRGAGIEPRYFRYPYLRRGVASRREAGAAVLDGLGYTVAPVTAATSEWRLAQLYVDANPERQQELREALVEHMVASLRAAAWQVRSRHGLEVPHIALLHVNELEAAGLGAAIDRLEHEGMTFVTLSEALAHPYYQRPDVQQGDRSLPWQLRIAPALEPGAATWFDAEYERLEARF